jgi:AmmeMemoRadiSam system protein B
MNSQKIAELRDKLIKRNPDNGSTIKILFVPDGNVTNDEQLFRLYGTLEGATYESVVFVESRTMETDKKIPMPTASYFDTEFGAVNVNDPLRNEFCDEDDDFYIDDVAFGNDLQIYRHLPYLISTLGDFSVVSVPICDDEPSIVRELAYVLSEIMGGRNLLLVISSSLVTDEKTNQKLQKHVKKRDFSNIMNLANSGKLPISGSAAFLAGLLISDSWELDISFLDVATPQESAISGFARLQVK